MTTEQQIRELERAAREAEAKGDLCLATSLRWEAEVLRARLAA